MKINNLPTNLKKYVVARGYDGEYWFWGTWDREIDAYNVSQEVSGQVFTSDDVEKGDF